MHATYSIGSKYCRSKNITSKKIRSSGIEGLEMLKQIVKQQKEKVGRESLELQRRRTRIIRVEKRIKNDSAEVEKSRPKFGQTAERRE
jgi:hypothetical protein